MIVYIFEKNSLSVRESIKQVNFFTFHEIGSSLKASPKIIEAELVLSS